jgi:Tfp pilus assembly protein PilW
MKNLLRLLLKNQHQQNRSGQSQTEKGMTLIELLIGTVMAFLILTPMLAFVVDMLNTDRREQVKANTEQDIQAAVDFIAQDLSQAIYIYDNSTTDGIPKISNFLPPATTTQTPILVFWKRQLQKNALPLTAGTQPDSCVENTVSGTGACNDTYVLSLVAYYQVSTPDSTWCQPSGGTCPTRIARYQIRDGLKDPQGNYYTQLKTGQEASTAYEPSFDISKPAEKVTKGSSLGSSDVLVNYIDHNQVALTGNECQTALSNPRTTDSSNALIDETTLKITSTLVLILLEI